MRKKTRLANLLFGRLHFITLPVLGLFRPKYFYVLAYHRVSPLPNPDYPFDEEIISVTPEEFDKQIRFLKNHFNVINFKILSDILSSEESPPENSLVITFDDGYADIYDNAYKILKAHDLTATIYVSTSYMDSSDVFWFDKLAYLIKTIPPGTISLDSSKFIFDLTNSNREVTLNSVRQLLRSVSNQKRLRLFEELEQQANIQISPDLVKLAKPLTWDQVKKMSDNGIEIGSHTVSHPFLTQLTREELYYELTESKKIIEDTIGQPVKSVAYPNGIYNHDVKMCANDCGYQFGIAYYRSASAFEKSKMFDIPRIPIETDVNFSLFQAYLYFPQLFVKFPRRSFSND